MTVPPAMRVTHTYEFFEILGIGAALTILGGQVFDAGGTFSWTLYGCWLAHWAWQWGGNTDKILDVEILLMRGFYALIAVVCTAGILITMSMITDDPQDFVKRSGPKPLRVAFQVTSSTFWHAFGRWVTNWGALLTKVALYRGRYLLTGQ